ncbi:MAG: S8 family serine peptidase [Candidatus Cloacimonetes bacterium]|nr:S8 family serine peptidase [Candidatus Cloacimonadota bacterium]
MYFKKKSIFFSLLLVFLTISVLVSENLEDFHPGMITVCFSADLVENTRGELAISIENGIIQTPFEWLNELAEEYQIVNLRRLYQVKNKEWHLNGQYPMNVFRLETSSHSRTGELLNILTARSSDVLFAEPLAVNRFFYVPNDPLLSDQYHHALINSFDAWDLEIGSPEIVVGIVDSAVKWNHPDLAANMWINEAELPGITINWTSGAISGGDGIDNDGNGYIDDVMGWNFWPGQQENNPIQIYNNWSHATHGTHVAGIVAAVGDNGVGIAGVAYNVKMLATKHQGNIPELYNGVYYTVDTGVHVINCSWGASGNANDATLASTYAKDHGVLMVAAAGNNNNATIQYPSGAQWVLAVASTNQNDIRSSFSSYGAWVDVSAPGTDIYSTYFTASGEDTYYDMSGTSMASPVVAGLAALLLSRNPSLSVEELMEAIKEGADPIDHLNPQFAGQLGTGRVNAFNSLMLVAPLEFDMEATTISGLIGAPLNTTAIYTFGLTNQGSEPASGYYVNLMAEGIETPLASAPGIYLEYEESGSVSIEWIPTELGDYVLYGQIEWELDERDRNDKSNSLEMRVNPEGNAEAYIGNKNSNEALNNSFINYNSHDSIVQMIYLEYELTPGLIYQMTVRFTGAHTLVFPGSETSIYMATTEKNSFSNNTDWVAYDQFTRVFKGDLEAFSIGTYEIEIIFDNPFYYQGDNLVVMVVKDDSVVYGLGNVFQFTTMSEQNRTMWWRSNMVGTPVLNPMPTANGILSGVTNARFGIYTFDIQPPKNLVATPDLENNRVSLSFEAPEPQQIGSLNNYKVYKNGNVISETTALTFNDNNIALNTEYEYWITAVYRDPNIESKPSNKVKIVVENIKPPISLEALVVDDDTVILTWEMDNLLQRSEDHRYGFPIGFKISRNGEPFPGNLIIEQTFTEHDVPVGEHVYGVIAVYQTGEANAIFVDVEIEPVTDYDGQISTLTTELVGNHPNPFNPETTIRFNLSVESNVQIDIFNIRGQKIRNLINTQLETGKHSVVWNGRDDNGNELGSGIYFYVMKTEDYTQVRRMALLK